MFAMMVAYSSPKVAPVKVAIEKPEPEIKIERPVPRLVTNNALHLLPLALSISRRKHWIGMRAPSSSLMISTLRIGSTVRRTISAR
jgi:hypothetical protein